MSMNTERIRRFAYITVAALGVAIGAYLFLRHALGAVLPFLIAMCITSVVDRPAHRLSGRLHISVPILRLVLTLLTVLLVLGVFGMSLWGIAVRIIDVMQNGGFDKISEILGSITEAVGGIFGKIGEGVGDAILSLIGSVVESLGGFVSATLGGIPRAFLFLLVTVISAIYLALDLETVLGFIRRLMPGGARQLLGRIRSSFLSTLVKYLRSYLALMLLTFGVMLVGLLLLGRREVLILALVIAVLDVLPAIGVGVVLLPWSLYCFIVRDVGLGVGLLVLYLVHTVIRQLAEPKILGKSLGVHPTVTLLLLYAGYSLFGVLGILLVPVFTVLIEALIKKDDSPDIKEGTARE